MTNQSLSSLYNLLVIHPLTKGVFMNYQQFVMALKEKVASKLGQTVDVQIHTALKNNGYERVGLTISEKHINLSPTIYLEEYFKHFEDDDSIDDIADSILHVYHEIRFEHSWQVHTISNFENMKEKIVYKIIHAPQNEVLLQTLPSIAYLDFAIVFYILFEIDEKGTATIPVTEDLLQVWETTLDEIHELAKQNTPKLLPAVFKPMRIVIDELMGNPCNNLIQSDDIMFVLTNSLRSFGAICILYEDVLFHIGNLLRENYYILPSSIHEVIIIPESQAPCKETLNEMITEINETQVEIEDVLSDHVYYYNREKKELLQH